MDDQRGAVARATEAASETRPVQRESRLLIEGERFGLLGLMLIAVVLFVLLQPDSFATVANLQAILGSQSTLVVLALALMIPLIAGNFDLSVGANAIASGILAAGMMAHHEWGIASATVAALVFAVLIGVINGYLVAYRGLNGLIATLGTATVLTGLISSYTDDQAITKNISGTLTDLGIKNILGIPMLAAIALVVAVVVGYVITQTPVGRRLTAIGSSSSAARLVGIRVARITFLSFVVAGLLAGVAGMMIVAQQGSGNPAVNGVALLLPALAAVYLGASTLFPGQFNVPGTVLGLLFVAVIVSGLTLSGAAPWVESVVNGTALIIAVGASTAFRRRRMGEG